MSETVELESNRASSPMENKERIPPNGGAKAWACVAGSFLLQFCSFGYVNAWVTLLSPHLRMLRSKIIS